MEISVLINNFLHHPQGSELFCFYFVLFLSCILLIILKQNQTKPIRMQHPNMKLQNMSYRSCSSVLEPSAGELGSCSAATQ